MIADLRSDTFTKPTQPMLECMMQAPVGDDVFSEDPSVNALEEKAAAMFGMDAAIFCPSGTMTNQIAIKCHTQPGDEVICDHMSHVYIYEGGGIAFNSGCQVRPIVGNLGRIKAAQVEAAINPVEVYKARTKLVSLENTANRGGGSCYLFSDIQEIKKVCLNNNLKLHMDGARLWNALVSKNETAIQYGEIFDSISICLSKGLGAPVGSLLLGSADFIHLARRVRKVLGGGMRQAGYLASAGIYALDHHINRLHEDHIHCQTIADALKQKDFIKAIMPVETNILIAEFQGRYTAAGFCTYLKEKQILCLPISSTQIRMITHLDVTPAMIKEIVQVIHEM